MSAGRAAAGAFWAIAGAFAAWCALLYALEPIRADGWLHEIAPLGPWDAVKAGYLELNPRAGEWVTRLAHQVPAAGAAALTASAVATLVALFVLAFGAWPRPSQPRDAWRFGLITALFLVGVPYIGQTLCYRPFAGNYVFGFACTLWLAVPYRLGRGRTWWVAPLGLLAGYANEHTGVGAAVALVAMTLPLARRRGGRPPAWAVAGLVGLVVGQVVLLTAPGHAVKYAGLAQQRSILETVLGRGLSGNALILLWFLACAVVPTGALAVAWVARRLRRERAGWTREAGVALAAAGVMLATLLASPKQGPRLFHAPAMLVVLAAAMALDAEVRGPRARRALAAAAALVALAIGAKLATVQWTTHTEATARRALLAAAAPGSVAVVPPLSHYLPTWWSVGDDFRAGHVRHRVARKLYGLDDIVLDVKDPELLRRTGLSLRYASGNCTAEQLGELEQKFGQPGLIYGPAQRAENLARFRAAKRALAYTTCGHDLRVVVEHLDFKQLGGRTIIAAPEVDRWPPLGDDAYLLRVGEGLRSVDAKDAARDVQGTLEPWGPGGYLLLVCDDLACYVVATAEQRASAGIAWPW